MTLKGAVAERTPSTPSALANHALSPLDQTQRLITAPDQRKGRSSSTLTYTDENSNQTAVPLSDGPCQPFQCSASTMGLAASQRGICLCKQEHVRTHITALTCSIRKLIARHTEVQNACFVASARRKGLDRTRIMVAPGQCVHAVRRAQPRKQASLCATGLSPDASWAANGSKCWPMELSRSNLQC